MTRYFNGGTQPLVLRWGEGVIMPGEHVDTDLPLGPPWTVDDEASQAVDAAQATEPSASPADAASVAEDAPQDGQPAVSTDNPGGNA